MYRRQGSRTPPRKRKAKWLSEEALQIAVKRKEMMPICTMVNFTVIINYAYQYEKIHIITK